MVHIKDGLLFKPQLSDFSALVLHHTVVLFLLTHSCGGQSQPIVAMVGGDIILPCHLDPALDVSDLTVEWARPDLDPRFVHLRRDGVELLLEEHPSYMGRTSLSTNKLKCGDISLKISKVKLSDAGTYKCLIPTSGRGSEVELAVGSVSSPDIKISKVSDGVLLDCKSKGWYPEPEVLWLDGEGKLLSAGPTKTVRGPDGLYTVSSRVTVEKRDSNSFTCRVQQKNINQTRETQIHVTADLFMVQSNSAVRIIVCLAVCFMSVGAVVLVVWKWGQIKNKTTNSSKELYPLMEGDREQHMTGSEKMTYLDKTKEKLNEELQKNEGELQHVQQVITTLKNQKEDLKNQREKLIPLLQEDKTQIEENKKKLKEKTKVDKEKKMDKRKKTEQDLKNRVAEHETLLKNTGKLLETTEELIIRMTERKGKLERDVEQINKNLKETERLREEIQRKLQLEQSEREEERNDPSSNDPV